MEFQGSGGWRGSRVHHPVSGAGGQGGAVGSRVPSRAGLQGDGCYCWLGGLSVSFSMSQQFTRPLISLLKHSFSANIRD